MYKIKVYKKGSTFYHENYELISSNLHYEVFFRLDAENLIKASKQEFAISVNEGYKRLCVIRTAPFNAIYIGDSDLAPILADYLIDNRFVLTDFSAPKEVGIKLMDQFNKRHINCTLKISMNYMKCLNSNLTKDERVINAQEKDLDEIFELMNALCTESGIQNCETKEMIKNEIYKYRIIRNKNEIMAMSKISDSTEKDYRISDVYTRPQHRGEHLATSLVSSCVCEINERGRFATLSVDENNPISSHIYYKIGFRKTFESGYFVIQK